MKNHILTVLLSVIACSCSQFNFAPEAKKITDFNKYLQKIDIANKGEENKTRKWMRIDGFIDDLRGIESFENLESLHLQSCKEGLDFSPIRHLYSLKKIEITDLSDKNINKIFNSSINFRLVEELRISYCKLQNLSFLSYLPNLKRLSLNYTEVENMEGLSELKLITELEANNCGLTSINFVSDLHELKALSLCDNRIRDVSPISRLKNIRTLNLRNNFITDIPRSDNWKKLEWVNLAHNKIEDIDSFLELKKLKELDLNCNRVLDISIFSKMTGIRLIKLENNPVKNIPYRLRDNNVKEIVLSYGNIIDYKSIVSALRNRIKLNLSKCVLEETILQLQEKKNMPIHHKRLRIKKILAKKTRTSTQNDITYVRNLIKKRF